MYRRHNILTELNVLLSMEMSSLMYSKLCFNLAPHTGGCLCYQLVRSLAPSLPMSIDLSF